MSKSSIHDALLGLAIGDALGVPVEFKNRMTLEKDPVQGMREFGTHNQPIGTWSDDSSMTFCTAEALVNGYSLEAIASYFVSWYDFGLWTPHGVLFDIGMTTSDAIYRIKSGISPYKSGMSDEYNNGNGSLMRILPLAFYLKDKDIEERFQICKEVSSITHAHIRSVMACFIYIEYVILLLSRMNYKGAYQDFRQSIIEFLKEKDAKESLKFYRILTDDISQLSRDEIYGSGYVLHSLEASFWCLLTSNSYSETVLKAVNLGEDTDTTAAIAGGLAGLVYGMENIPEEWLSVLVKKEGIMNLCDRLSKKYPFS